MTDTERHRRWNTAKERYRPASLCFDHGLYGASVTRSYYASYHTIWIAVGDPPLGRWRYHGAIHQFCRGGGPRRHRPRQRLRGLYDWRTDADYTARTSASSVAQEGLTLTQEILALVAQAKGLPFP